MKESGIRIGLKIRLEYIAIAIIFIGLISVITSYITVKTLLATSPVSTPTTTSVMGTDKATILPTAQPSPTLYVLPSVTSDSTQLERPEIETNLIQNGNFENGLAGWIYTNGQAGITTFEITGMNGGKAYCSRRFLFWNQADALKKESVGFAQDLPVDPTKVYYFSAWVKLYRAYYIAPYANFYYGPKEMFLEYLQGNSLLQSGKTTDGWIYIQSHLSESPTYGGPPVADHVVVGFWHLPITEDIESYVDTTFCIDDVVLGKEMK